MTSEHDYNEPKTADEIQKRMQQKRSHLQPEMVRIVEDAQTLMDWKYYLHRSPWILMGVAAVTGYVLVPKRTQVVSPDAATLEKLSKNQKLVVEPQSKANARSGPIASLAKLAALAVFRAGMGYVSDSIGKQMNKQSGKSQQSNVRQQHQEVN